MKESSLSPNQTQLGLGSIARCDYANSMPMEGAVRFRTNSCPKAHPDGALRETDAPKAHPPGALWKQVGGALWAHWTTPGGAFWELGRFREGALCALGRDAGV